MMTENFPIYRTVKRWHLLPLVPLALCIYYYNSSDFIFICLLILLFSSLSGLYVVGYDFALLKHPIIEISPEALSYYVIEWHFPLRAVLVQGTVAWQDISSIEIFEKRHYRSIHHYLRILVSQGTPVIIELTDIDLSPYRLIEILKMHTHVRVERSFLLKVKTSIYYDVWPSLNWIFFITLFLVGIWIYVL